jgi:hypothetical protein
MNLMLAAPPVVSGHSFLGKPPQDGQPIFLKGAINFSNVQEAK